MKHTPPPLDLPASAVLSIRKTEKLSDGITALSGTEGVSHVSVKQMMFEFHFEVHWSRLLQSVSVYCAAVRFVIVALLFY